MNGTLIYRSDSDGVIAEKSRRCESIALAILIDTQHHIDYWFNRRRNGLIGIYDIIQGSAYSIQYEHPYTDVADSDKHVSTMFVSRWVLNRLGVRVSDGFFYYEEDVDLNRVVTGWRLPFLDSRDHDRFMYCVTNIINGAIEMEDRRLRGI